MRAFASFFELDQDLVAAAAEGDAPAEDPLTDTALEAFVRSFPEEEKNALLLRVLRGEGATIPGEIRRRCRESMRTLGRGLPELQPRRVGDLRAAAAIHAQARQRRAEEQAALERARHERAEADAQARRLRVLEKRVEAAWREVESLIEMKRAAEYKQAVALLLDLKALAVRDGWEADFLDRIDRLRARHFAKTALKARLNEAGLLGREG